RGRSASASGRPCPPPARAARPAPAARPSRAAPARTTARAPTAPGRGSVEMRRRGGLSLDHFGVGIVGRVALAQDVARLLPRLPRRHRRLALLARDEAR